MTKFSFVVFWGSALTIMASLAFTALKKQPYDVNMLLALLLAMFLSALYFLISRFVMAGVRSEVTYHHTVDASSKWPGSKS